MSLDANPDVQVASSSLSLEDLRRSIQLRAEESTEADAGSPGPTAHEEPEVPSEAACSADSDQGECLVVRVPIVGRDDVHGQAEPAPEILQRLPLRDPGVIHSVPFIEPVNSDTPVIAEVLPEVEDLAEIRTELPDSRGPVPPPTRPAVLNDGSPVADLPESPEEWIPKRDSKERRTTKTAKPLDAPKQAFRDLTDNVLQEFPLRPATVLLIADVDGHSSGYTVAYQLAWHLANRKVGKVLVVDSHFEGRRLTEGLNLGNEAGWADMVAGSCTLKETVCETQVPNLDVLPVGSRLHCKRQIPGEFSVQDHVQELKDEYPFVIVAVGNVFHRATTLWGRHCDATYLAIEMNSSNQTLAKSGVVRLQQFGARLMGCVVTDAAA